jgi:hypothetical protein
VLTGCQYSNNISEPQGTGQIIRATSEELGAVLKLNPKYFYYKYE